MRVLLLSRYGRLGASSRVRSLQFIPYLESQGWDVVVMPLFSDKYLRALYSGHSRVVNVIFGYWRRLICLIKVKEYDLIWIEKEIFPFLPAFMEILLSKMGVPYVVDYDDALFHRYDRNCNWLVRVILGHKIDSVMRNASLVIAGNKYLADKARNVKSRNVAIIPTVVDLTRYQKRQQIDNRSFVIGWIGSPSTSKYLLSILPVIKSLKKSFNVRFIAVGASEEVTRDTEIEILPWSEETEVRSIQTFDVGIMPLFDNPWERGKCGYKLIQYMACGVPVVASPVGVNKEIVKNGFNGFLAQDVIEWERALFQLLSDEDLRRQMGDNGRDLVEAQYSLQMQAPRLESLLCDSLS